MRYIFYLSESYAHFLTPGKEIVDGDGCGIVVVIEFALTIGSVILRTDG
jgi:hypothetical protein